MKRVWTRVRRTNIVEVVLVLALALILFQGWALLQLQADLVASNDAIRAVIASRAGQRDRQFDEFDGRLKSLEADAARRGPRFPTAAPAEGGR